MKDRLLLLGGLLMLVTGLAGLFGAGVVTARGSGSMGMMGNAMMDNSTQPYDLRFLSSMIVHHEGAVMSSKMMIADSERPEMRALARAIVKSQTEQIGLMKEWRRLWYGDRAADTGTTSCERMMDAGTGMMGGTMGEGRDEMFLEMMIPHHQAAVDMSNDALSKAQRPELKTLARKIIAEQTAQIELMQRYLKAWYPDRPGRMRGMMGS
jgi:uncharacterized protein (DUF305 family)